MAGGKRLPLTLTLFSAVEEISFEDDLTVILLLGVSFVATGLP
jgi:hypothetical protein